MERSAVTPRSKEDMKVVERFYRALMGGKDLARYFDDESFFYVPGSTEISGEFKGKEAVASLFVKMRELTEGTLRPFLKDSLDVMASEHHCVLLDRLLAERPDGRRLDSQEAWVIHVNDNKLGNSFIYLGDPDSFDTFWS